MEETIRLRQCCIVRDILQLAAVRILRYRTKGTAECSYYRQCHGDPYPIPYIVMSQVNYCHLMLGVNHKRKCFTCAQYNPGRLYSTVIASSARGTEQHSIMKHSFHINDTHNALSLSILRSCEYMFFSLSYHKH